MDPSLEELPLPVILHILSFLPTLNAVATSLVSRKFRRLWMQVPSLNFDYSQFPLYNCRSVTLRCFCLFVDRTLLLRDHSHSLDSLHLSFPYEPLFRSSADAWIQYAVRCRTRKISVQFVSDAVNAPYYDFPLFILRGGAVESLSLYQCDIRLSKEHLHSMRYIDFTRIYLTDQMLGELLECCHNLEEFKLGGACGLEKMVIRSPKLRFLELRRVAQAENGLSLEVDCPSLVGISFVLMQLERIDVINLSSVETFRVWFTPEEDSFVWNWSLIASMIEVCPRMKLLASPNWWFKMKPRDAFGDGFVLKNLKHVVLQTKYRCSDIIGLAEFLKVSPNLEILTLIHAWLPYEDVTSMIRNLFSVLLQCNVQVEELETDGSFYVELSLPSLRELKMERCLGIEAELNFLRLAKSQGVVLKNANVYYRDANNRVNSISH